MKLVFHRGVQRFIQNSVQEKHRSIFSLRFGDSKWNILKSFLPSRCNNVKHLMPIETQ